MNISTPTILDNRNLRQENPSIQQHFNESMKELETFPKQNGIIQDTQYVDWINCPVCGNNNTLQWIVKWGGRYDQCPRCSHIFLKNRFKPTVLTGLYKNSAADKKDREVQKHSFNTRYWNAIYSKYLAYFLTLHTNDASLLDVGCGSGQFLKYCQENGMTNLFGLDIYLDLHEQISSFIPKENLLLVESFEDSSLRRKFEMIFLWGVLEHLPDPNRVFPKLAEYLEPDGHVFLLIPNIHSRARRLLGVHTPTINPRQHVNFFTRRSMDYLCKKHRFEIVHFGYELPIIDLMWPFIHEEDDLLKDIARTKEGYYHVYILKYIL